MSGKRSEQEAVPDSMPGNDDLRGFISECLQVLASTTIGTAIYILSCLCPDDFEVILDLAHLDLHRPHQHTTPRKKNVHVPSSSYTNVISHLRRYIHVFPGHVYGRAWLEVVRRWLLTCPIDPDFYLENEKGEELYCQKLRSLMIDRILKID